MDQILARLSELEKSLAEAVQAAEAGRLPGQKQPGGQRGRERTGGLRQLQMTRIQEKTECP